MAKRSMEEMVAFATFCAKNKLSPDAAGRKAWEKSLLDPNAPVGKRGRKAGQPHKQIVASFYGKDGLLSSVKCDNVQSARTSALVGAMVGHGIGVITSAVYSDLPVLTRLGDGSIVYGEKVIASFNPSAGEAEPTDLPTDADSDEDLLDLDDASEESSAA